LIVRQKRLYTLDHFANTNNEYPPKIRTAKSGLIRENAILGNFANFDFKVFPISELDGV